MTKPKKQALIEVIRKWFADNGWTETDLEEDQLASAILELDKGVGGEKQVSLNCESKGHGTNRSANPEQYISKKDLEKWLKWARGCYDEEETALFELMEGHLGNSLLPTHTFPSPKELEGLGEQIKVYLKGPYVPDDAKRIGGFNAGVRVAIDAVIALRGKK